MDNQTTATKSGPSASQANHCISPCLGTVHECQTEHWPWISSSDWSRKLSAFLWDKLWDTSVVAWHFSLWSKHSYSWRRRRNW